MDRRLRHMAYNTSLLITLESMWQTNKGKKKAAPKVEAKFKIQNRSRRINRWIRGEKIKRNRGGTVSGLCPLYTLVLRANHYPIYVWKQPFT